MAAAANPGPVIPSFFVDYKLQQQLEQQKQKQQEAPPPPPIPSEAAIGNGSPGAAGAAVGATTKNQSNNSNNNPTTLSKKKSEEHHPLGLHPAKRGVIIISAFEILFFLVLVCNLVDNVYKNDLGSIIRYSTIGIVTFIGIVCLIIGGATQIHYFFIPYFGYRILAIFLTLAAAIYGIFKTVTMDEKTIRSLYPENADTSFYKPLHIMEIIFGYLIELLLCLFFLFGIYECYGYFRGLKTSKQQQHPGAATRTVANE